MTMYQFKIEIGDWSGDGHGRHEDLWFEATKPIEDVREAYFAAKKRLPELCPETFCNEYDDVALPDGVHQALLAAGCSVNLDDWNWSTMALVVAWFIQQGDPAIGISRCQDPPSLAFYGYDKKNRHIGFIGYGLLGT